MSKLWGNLQQVEVTTFSGSACAFVRTCTLGIPGKRWISVLLHTTFLTALRVSPIRGSKIRVKGNWSGRIFFLRKVSSGTQPRGMMVSWHLHAAAMCQSLWLTSLSALFLSLQSTFCKLQTQFWSRIAFLCQGLVASREIKAATTLALRTQLIKAVDEIRPSPSSMAD